MKKLLIVIFAVSCIQTNVFAQSVYNFNINDVIIGGISLGVGITPFLINNEPEKVSGILNKNRVNSLDRPLMFSHKKNLDLFSDYYCGFAIASLPIISVIPNAKDKNTVITYSIMYSEALSLTFGTVFSLKNAITRYRPYMYADGIPNGKKDDYHNSFPSSSVAFSFLGATFLTTTFATEFPDSKWKLPLIIGSYTLAASTGAMRIASGAHFLTDVLTGAAIGSLYGWLIPWLHLNKEDQKVTIVPMANGVMVALRF